MIISVDTPSEGAELLVVVVRYRPFPLGRTIFHASGLVERVGEGYEMRLETIVAYRGSSAERQGMIARAWRDARADESLPRP